MKNPWLFILTFFIHLNFTYGQFFSNDEYDPGYLVDQFRRHYQDRRQQVFRSREGNYHPVADAGDERNNDYRNFAGYYPVRRNNQWGQRAPAAEAVPLLNTDTKVDIVPKDATEDQEIDRLEGIAEKNVDSVDSTGDKFKVYARAQARQLGSSYPEHEDVKHYQSPVTTATSDMYFIALVAGCSAAAVFGVMAAGFCWYKFQKNAKAAAEAEYPAYGVTGPNKEHISPSGGGDRKLAQSAQMYHYQHQKQQMIAMEKTNGERQVSTSDLDSEEENEEGDYTVYECPGLAPTGEMEVKNPLFQDEPTPASPPVSTKPSSVVDK